MPTLRWTPFLLFLPALFSAAALAQLCLLAGKHKVTSLIGPLHYSLKHFSICLAREDSLTPLFLLLCASVPEPSTESPEGSTGTGVGWVLLSKVCVTFSLYMRASPTVPNQEHSCCAVLCQPCSQLRSRWVRQSRGGFLSVSPRPGCLTWPTVQWAHHPYCALLATH